MPRRMRVQYAGALYHVRNLGDRREGTFADDVDRQDFLQTLAEACQKTGWQVHAYRLIRNHFQLTENHSRELHRETAEQKANRLIAQETSRLGWIEAEPISRLKNDSGIMKTNDQLEPMKLNTT